MEMVPIERARRDEEVGFGITSFGVVSKKIQWYFCQGLFCKYSIYIRVLARKSTDKRKGVLQLWAGLG
jgi:hypothetical protein